MLYSNNHISISENHKIKKNNLFWILQLSGWSIFSILLCLTLYAKQINGKDDIIATIITFSLGLLLTTSLRYLYRVIRYRIKSIVLLSIIIIVTSYLTSIAWFFLDLLFSRPFMPEFMWYQINLMPIIITSIYYDYLILPWSVLYFFICFWIDWSTQKKQAEKNKFLYKEAQLTALRYQLNPHFLFNSLNSIQTLVYQNPKIADKMITSLSDFLRYNLNYLEKLEISLIEEINIIKQYLSIEKIRFEERLEYDINVSDKTKKIRIPTFIIQPFIENAIKHGMKTNPNGIKIEIIAFLNNNSLIIEINNTGEWIPEIANTGIGIKNVKERLKNTYPEKYLLKIDNINGWIKVLIKIDSIRES